jgi:hypothetical protein
MSDVKAAMTKMEKAEMLAELMHRLCDLTSDYVESVRKMFQTYPELKRGIDIVVAMDMFDISVVRCIMCSSGMRDNLVTELKRL